MKEDPIVVEKRHIAKIAEISKGRYDVTHHYKEGTQYYVDLFCKDCYHMWYHVLYNNAIKPERSCATCHKIERVMKATEKARQQRDSKGLHTLEFITYLNRDKRDFYKYRCPKCGCTFEVRGKFADYCIYCSKFRRLTALQQQIKLGMYTSYQLCDLQNYKGANQKNKIRCRDCGTISYRRPHNLYTFSCKTCSDIAQGNVTTWETFKFELAKRYNDEFSLVYEPPVEYNSTLHIKVRHNKCGNIMTTNPNQILTAEMGCTYCTGSIPEQRIYRWLKQRGIKFTSQKTFKTCVNKIKLPFDFSLDQNHILIEYDGEQHYKDNAFFYHKENNNDSFEYRRHNDEIKDEWCRDNGYKLYRIPYTEECNIERILEKIIMDNNVSEDVVEYNSLENAGDSYPYYAMYKYVMGVFRDHGVTIEGMAQIALENQLEFDKSLKIGEAIRAVDRVMLRRDILNLCATGMAMDYLANKHMLPEPLNSVITNDDPNFSVDEELALGITHYYGTVAMTQFGELDVHKKGDAKRLDKMGSDGVEVTTFIDDLVSAIISCAEAKIMNDHAGDTSVLRNKLQEAKVAHARA